MSSDVDDRRIALVTGGSRGIGASVVEQFLDRGLGVAYTSRMRSSCPHPEQRDAIALRYELGEDAPDAVVADVIEHFGQLDSVVINAGVWAGAKLETSDEGSWWRVVELNLRTCAQFMRAALPYLRQSSRPSVVLVSSAVGLVGFAGDTSYASAKAAMIGFARSLAKEMGTDGVRVNVVAPGFVETDMTSSVSDGARARIVDSLILSRFGTADEIGKAVIFLSEDATYSTGTILTIDGGWTL